MSPESALTANRRRSDEPIFTNRDSIALYLQYPDLHFDDPDDDSVDETDAEGATLFSTPVSHSTTHTTPPPPRPPGADEDQHGPAVDEHDEFLRVLRNSDLPSSVCAHYHSLCTRILLLSTHIFPSAGFTTEMQNTSVAEEMSGHLVNHFDAMYAKVDGEAASVEHIQTLAPFHVRPKPEDRWVNYVQKMYLVIRYVQLRPNMSSTTHSSCLERKKVNVQATLGTPSLHRQPTASSSIPSSGFSMHTYITRTWSAAGPGPGRVPNSTGSSAAYLTRS